MNTLGAERLLEVGLRLSSEHNPNKLLDIIISAAMDITGCDGGTLYTCSGDALQFRIMVTKSMNVYKGLDGEEINMPPVPLQKQNVCAYAAITGDLINVADVYTSEKFDFSGPRKYDAMTGYRTQSMLVIPMKDDFGDMIGVLQLLNAKDADGNIVPFGKDCEPIIQTLAFQTATCLTNMNYAKEIERLLNSFVKVMSTAIDARTPYNANHTANMARYGATFIDWLNDRRPDWSFSKGRRMEFLMSIWLHDVGKIVIPLDVMDKDTRLGNRISEVMHRLKDIELLGRIAFLSGEITKEQLADLDCDVESARAFVTDMNKQGFMTDEAIAAVDALASRTYKDTDGSWRPWLTQEEKKLLSIRKGTLSAEERGIMESHVMYTKKLLDQMAFSKSYEHVPIWASLHHEYLNGTGYPEGLKAEDIPKEVRIITIIDIFDALTARDRPYKKPLSPERAMEILTLMGKEGQLDSELVELFGQSQAWIERRKVPRA